MLCEMKTFITDIFNWVKESEQKGNFFLHHDLWNSDHRNSWRMRTFRLQRAVIYTKKQNK